MADPSSPPSPAQLMSARPNAPLSGKIRVPGDKSISHRALMLGALAVGRTEISGLLEGEDVLATAAALNALGAAAAPSGDGRWIVDGVGVGGLCEPENLLDLGNSGTSARLLLGILATHPLTAFVTGDASLRRRPMGRVVDPLSRFGASFLTREGARLPLAVTGAADPIPIVYRLAGALGPGQIGGVAGWAQHSGRDHGDRAAGDPRPHRADAAPLRRDGHDRTSRRRRQAHHGRRFSRTRWRRRLRCRAMFLRLRSLWWRRCSFRDRR